MHDRQTHRRVLMLLVLAAAIRWGSLGNQSLSMDEVLELQTAALPAAEIVTLPNSYPPLYHLLLKAWCLVDSSQFAPRHFSVLIGVASIFAIWKLLATAVSQRVALAATAIATISPIHVYYSQEGRANILFLLLTVLAVHYGLRLAQGVTIKDQLMFACVGICGGYTHYYFAFVLVAIGCGVLLWRGPTEFLRRMGPAAVAIGVACMPLCLLLKSDITYQRNLREPRPASVAAIGYTLFSFESGYTLGPSRSQLHGLPPREAALMAVPWLLLVGLYMVPTAIRGIVELAKRRELSYWLSVLCVPLLLTIIASRWFGMTYNTRFLVCCWVPYVVIMASGLMAFSAVIRCAVGLLMFVVAMTAFYHHHWLPAYANPDIRAAVQYVDQFEPRPILVCAGYMNDVVRHYADQRETHQPMDIRRLMDWGYPEGSTTEALRTVAELGDQRFWLIYSRSFHGDPDGEILSRLVAERSLKAVFEAPGVVVYESRE